VDEAVVFQSSVESLRRTTAGRLSPAARSRLANLGFDFDRPLLTAYALGPWEQVTEAIVVDLFPGLPLPEARVRLGRLFMEGYGQTTIGQAAVLLGKAIGVRRTLARMTRNMRNGNNYTETDLVERGPGHVELVTRMLPQYLPAWAGKPNPLGEQFVGVLQAAMEQLGAREARVTLHAYDSLIRQTTYLIRWRE
jgi:uncharacterized protein (TIGR02265 family)